MQPVSPLQRQKPSGLGPSQNHRCWPGFREPAPRQVHFEVLESRCLLNADLVISELLASNLEGHLDFFDNDSDWIEIHNRGTSRALLDGWRITDDLDDLEKWQFPVGTFVEPDQRLLVYASDRDLVTSTGELHTNFRLDPDGEPLALVSPNGVVSDGNQSCLSASSNQCFLRHPGQPVANFVSVSRKLRVCPGAPRRYTRQQLDR